MEAGGRTSQDTSSLVTESPSKCQCSWRPTSDKALEVAEKKALLHVKAKVEGRYIPIDNGNKIWTLEVTGNAVSKPPIVLIHGLGAGAAIWAMNFDALAKERKVFAFDVLGFGRSSRPSFPEDSIEAEMLFVESVEQWRRKMALDNFILLGHSLGGFIAFSYAHRYPHCISHLVLADPWGVAEKPPDSELAQLPGWMKAVFRVLTAFNPFAAVRAAGPWGPAIVKKARGDIQRKFESMFQDEDDDTILNYLYHCNAQKPSGETAIRSLSIPYGWAKHPMMTRVDEIHSDLPITFIYGSHSWMNTDAGNQIRDIRFDSYVRVTFISGAGHHVYADDPDAFNKIVLDACNRLKTNDERGITMT